MSRQRNAETHSRQVVVWDVPSAIERATTFSIKVGVRCDSTCKPDAWTVEFRDSDLITVATVCLGTRPWPGTAALYYAEVELGAPDSEGLHQWEAVAPAVVGGSPVEVDQARRQAGNDARDDSGPAMISHAEARAAFSLRTVPAPECRLTVIAIDKENQTPIEGARVVVHPYRVVTDARGVAEIDLPKGAYRLFVSGGNHFPFRTDEEVTGDVTIRAELDLDIGPSDAELWS